MTTPPRNPPKTSSNDGSNINDCVLCNATFEPHDLRDCYYCRVQGCIDCLSISEDGLYFCSDCYVKAGHMNIQRLHRIRK